MTEPIVVTRAPRDPYVLRKLSKERGKSPLAVLTYALANFPTFAEAADDLGVSVETLRNWRTRYGIEVRDSRDVVLAAAS